MTTIVAGGLTAGTLAMASAPASADPVSLTLEYTCVYPLINAQDLTVNVTVDLPRTMVKGQPSPAFDITAINTVSANTTSGLALIGAKTIDGSAVSHVAVTAPGVSLPDVQVPVEVPSTPVPSSGAFDITATGQTPSLTFPELGEGTIVVNGLDLHMFARNAAGTPINLPGGNPDGSFDVDCTLKPGQDNQLTTFQVIQGENTAPSAADVTANTTAGTPVEVELKGTDPEGDTLTYAAGTPANGTVTVAGNKATYTPNAGFEGQDTFTYTVSDGALEATANVTVAVAPAPVNTPPAAADVTGATTAGSAVQVELKGTDADGDTLTYTAGTPANGTVTVAGNKATYTPNAGFVGPDTFTYTVSDGTEEATGNVSITVSAAPPVTKAATKVVLGSYTRTVRKGRAPVLRAKVLASGSARATGSVAVTCQTRAGGKTIVKVGPRTSYTGPSVKAVKGPKLTRKGRWGCSVKFTGSAKFKDSKSGRVTVRVR